MKYYRKFKLSWDRIEWGQSAITLGSNMYFYYFGWGILTKEDRKNLKELDTKPISRYCIWYDGPHVQLNLYFICFYWSTYWTKEPKDKSL